MIRCKKMLKVIFSPPVNLLLATFSLYRPIKLTQFRTNRIGHLALNTEVFLRRLQLDSNLNNNLYLLFPNTFIANQILYDKYKVFFKKQKNILLIENSILIKIINIMYRLTNKYRFVNNMNSNEYELFSKSNTSIKFSKGDDKVGSNFLKEMGIDSWYVCIFARDSAYLKTITDKEIDLSYHDFRDANIDDFELASKYIIDKGGYVVRLGNTVEKEMSFKHEKLIDYAFSDFKSAFMDIFLISKCKFVLATTSGATDICAVFNIPRAGVNWIPIDHLPWTSIRDISLVKKLKKNGKYIGLNEYYDLINNKKILPFNGSSYKQYNIQIEDNTPEEILDICIEMYESLNGTLSLTEEDIENQKKYQEIHKNSKQFSKVVTPMSYSFLRNNKWYIDDN